MNLIGSSSRHACARVASSDASSSGPPRHGRFSVCDRIASICRRSRGGIRPITLVSAWTDESSMPRIDPEAADCRPTAIATASSSSRSSGGRDPPARSW